MPGRTDGDKFAVRTVVVAGEEVALSHPYVTDAQRAAAGRETLAGRTRAMLAENRERAVARFTAGWLGDDEEVQRVWCRRDPAELGERLGARQAVVWAESDVLHVLWRGDGDRVMLGGGVSAPMWPVEGSPGLWEASMRIRRLDEAVLTLFVIALGPADLPFGRPATERLTWHGPDAPGDDTAGLQLAGTVRDHVLESVALRAARTVSVYTPPGGPPGARTAPPPPCVFADGESVRAFAQVLEPAIVSGDTPPVLLIGVHSAGDPANPADPRSQEYLPGNTPRRFEAHLRFVTGEVIPWAQATFPVAPGRWLAAGYSNGAAWAIGAAQRRPDVFGGVAAFSPIVVPARVTPGGRGIRHFLAAGTLETEFRRSTSEYAGQLRRTGASCTHREWPGGHDPFWWRRALPDALTWLLA